MTQKYILKRFNLLLLKGASGKLTGFAGGILNEKGAPRIWRQMTFFRGFSIVETRGFLVRIDH